MLNKWPDPDEPNRWALQSPVHDGAIPGQGEGGQYSPSFNWINPETGQADPTYTPPSSGTDQLGQSTYGGTVKPGGAHGTGGGPGSSPGGSPKGSIRTVPTSTVTDTALKTGGSGMLGGLSYGQWAMLGLSLLNDSKNPDGLKMVTTPEEKRIADAKWGLFNHSDMRDEVYGYARAGLGSMSGWSPNISYQSDYMKGQPVLGGYKMPTFNIPGGGTPAPGAVGAVPGGAADAKMQLSTLPATVQNPAGGQQAQGQQAIDGIYGKAISWLQEHPNTADAVFSSGGAALFQAIGVPALAGTTAGQWLLSRIQTSWGTINKTGGGSSMPNTNQVQAP